MDSGIGKRVGVQGLQISAMSQSGVIVPAYKVACPQSPSFLHVNLGSLLSTREHPIESSESVRFYLAPFPVPPVFPHLFQLNTTQFSLSLASEIVANGLNQSANI